MALFNTKRFLVGDGHTCTSSSSSEAILLKLHEKAKAKQKQSLDQLPVHTSVNNDQEPIKNKLTPQTNAEKAETPTTKKTSGKVKSKKKSDKKKSLPADVILKKLHAKAKAREEENKQIFSGEDVESNVTFSARKSNKKRKSVETNTFKKKKKQTAADDKKERKVKSSGDKTNTPVFSLEETAKDVSSNKKIHAVKMNKSIDPKPKKRKALMSDSKKLKQRKIQRTSSSEEDETNSQSSLDDDDMKTSSSDSLVEEEVDDDGSSALRCEVEEDNSASCVKEDITGNSDIDDDNDDGETNNHSNVCKKSEDTDIEVQDKEDNETNKEMERDQRSTKEGVSDNENEDDAVEEFAVLGGGKHKKKQKVSRVLPDWLAHPMLIEHDLQRHSVDVGEMKQLDSQLVQRLIEDGITRLFPVQRHVIPVILDSVKLGIHSGDAGYRPRDICVSAPTGSGKTLAFAIPIVQALLHRVVPRIRALVVLPTRDLAQQVHKVFTSLCKGTSLKAALVGGLKKFGQEQRVLVQTSNGETQCDIVVATPGRLVDHINKTQSFTLQHLRFLVIDEADRMMEQISKDWIAQVEKCAYKDSRRQALGPITLSSCAKIHMPLQKLLFSATLSQNPEKLTQLNLFQPRLITSVVTSKNRSTQKQSADHESTEERGEFVGKFTTPVGLSEHYVQCTPGEKPLVILHLIKTLQLRQILCFANTIEATHRLYHLIKLIGGVEVAEFSSNQTPGQRRQILKQFKAGKIQLLICSDAMARGMDVENAKYVISYDMPPYIKTYIHRVGRTARAGKTGVAYSLLQQYEVPKLLKMLKHAGKVNMMRHNVDQGNMEYMVESYEKALQKLPGILRMEKQYSL